MEKFWTDRDALGFRHLWGLEHKYWKLFEGFATLGSRVRGLGLEIKRNQFHKKCAEVWRLEGKKEIFT